MKTFKATDILMLLLVGALLGGTPAFADIYRYVDANGVTHFTNTPTHNNYDLYRKEGLFIGSGVIEAACKTVVAQRAKLSGMLWGVEGVQNVLTIRCLMLSGRLDPFLKHVLAERRAA